jgi:hypothetical protein
MANEFSKEERVAFEDICQGFEDALAMSRNVSIYRPDQVTMERTGDVLWRPMPYIAQSYDGSDQTANFKDQTQLSVPATIGYRKSSPWIMDSNELRDALQEKRLGDAAKQKLASDINVSVLEHASMFGSLFVKRVAAAAGYDDVAQCEAIMNEQGVPSGDRYLALSTRDYNGMANNLAGRGTVSGKVVTAYEKGYVGPVASFETYKLDYARRLTLAGGGAALTLTTLAAGGNVYVPQATDTATTGERSNVDNRFQNVVVSSTVGVAAGDAFTVATVEAVHHITKQSTGQLKTFRVVSITDATHMVITPPLITGQGGTDAELQYQNCTVGTPAANSAIVFLNTATAATNPFWHKDSIVLIPGRIATPADAGTAIMRATTEQGIEVVLMKQHNIDVDKVKYRLDTRYGVANLNPEMNGIMMFSQP